MIGILGGNSYKRGTFSEYWGETVTRGDHALNIWGNDYQRDQALNIGGMVTRGAHALNIGGKKLPKGTLI